MSELVFEGTWEEMLQRSNELAGQKVRVTVLTEGESAETPPTQDRKVGKPITFGMFPQLRDLTEEDFKCAEWHGEGLEDI
jgi:hypothetical protein